MTSTLLYGTEEIEHAPSSLTGGSLSAQFANGSLRNICFDGIEVLRGIQFLVRDRNWSTIEATLSSIEINDGPEGTVVNFVAEGMTASDKQRIQWKACIKLAENKLLFDVKAQADQDFLTCRTGFVVLHPLENTVGCPVVVEHSDGLQEHAFFPELVDPLPMFRDVVSMSHQLRPGIVAHCRMQGGSWESEDHRNWMDASFKTYYRSMDLPWPYEIKSGEIVTQSVELQIEIDETRHKQIAADEHQQLSHSREQSSVQVCVGDRTALTAPQVGIVWRGEEFDPEHCLQLKALHLNHVVARLATDDSDLPGRIRSLCSLLNVANMDVCLDIIVANRGHTACEELELLHVAATQSNLMPLSIAVASVDDLSSYPPSVDRPPGPTQKNIVNAARSLFPGIPVGGGSLAFFAELNRRQPQAGLLDFVQWGTNSINHAADDCSVMETLQTIPHQVRTAKSIALNTPIRLGPVHIAMPLNPYGEGPTPNPQTRRVTMAQQDPRHSAQFGASFLAGYLCRAAHAGVDAISCAGLVGPFGIFGNTGQIPATAVIDCFAKLAGSATLQCASSTPDKVLATAFSYAGTRILILVNITDAVQSVALSGCVPTKSEVHHVGSDGGFSEAATSKCISLPAYSIARIEG